MFAQFKLCSSRSSGCFELHASCRIYHLETDFLNLLLKEYIDSLAMQLELGDFKSESS